MHRTHNCQIMTGGGTHARMKYLYFIFCCVGILSLLNMHRFINRLDGSNSRNSDGQPVFNDDAMDESTRSASLLTSTSNALTVTSCNPADYHPVLDKIPSSADNPIRVGIVTVRSLADYHEGKHFLIDGTIGSHYLALHTICLIETLNGCPLDLLDDVEALHNGTTKKRANEGTKSMEESEIQLWIVDFIRTEMTELPSQNEKLIVDRLINNPTGRWKVLLVDFADMFYRNFLKGHNLWRPIRGVDRIYVENNTKYAPFPHLRYAARSMVENRKWNSKKRTVNVGSVDLRLMQQFANRTGDVPIHMPYAVRSDTVEELHQALPSCNFTKRFISPELREATRLTGFLNRPPPHTSRPTDVIHLWKVEEDWNFALYRSLVSKCVNELDGTSLAHITTSTNNSHAPDNGRRIVASTKLQGKRGNPGRAQVDRKYMYALLSSKIVIVTQRDKWEDHYRLMEALATGALVLLDTMLTLPRWLQDGTSVVFFTGIDDMKRKIGYYLSHEKERIAIAEQGWMIAMGRHRAWHRVEAAVFGCPLTNVF